MRSSPDRCEPLIGEIGLDYLWMKIRRTTQRSAQSSRTFSRTQRAGQNRHLHTKDAEHDV